jgi:2-polyprenyl-6-methoxyphenol hydroxylase-like FAD-dependent oxidoreductase
MTPIGDHIWDAVVVGAGVAGGCIASLLADRGWRVLLVEKSAWPRETVCGGCLSASSLQMLSAIGLTSALRSATPTNRVLWQQGFLAFEHPIPTGAMLLRIDLDGAIVERAINRGVTLQSACSAALLPARGGESFRTLQLRTDQRANQVRARVVIAADGLGGTTLRDEPWSQWTTCASARMGVASTIRTDWSEIEAGRIHMCLSKWGYAGIARADDQTVHVAAALDPLACKQAGGPPALIARILASCNRSVPPQLVQSKVLGTGKLTRHRKQLGGHRVLALGDACGYVEPVTGEGMAWAIRGAIEMNQLLPDFPTAWPSDLPLQWQRRHYKAIGQRQHWCRLLRSTVRHPLSTAVGLRLASAFPGAARSIAHLVCSPPRKDFSHDPSGHNPGSNIAQLNPPGDPGHRHRQPAGRPANAGA